MKYRYSLVNFALKHGVSKASRRYNKCRSYIYFWLNRYDGQLSSLAERSRRPHHHPSEHSESEIGLILRFQRQNADLGLLEFWFKLRKAGYKRHYMSLYRVKLRLGLGKPKKQESKKVAAKPYEAMHYLGQRVQIDVKHVPKACIKGGSWSQYYQYTAIDEFRRLRYLGACKQADTFSSADFVQKAVTWFARKGVSVACVQTDNGFEFTSHFNKREDNDRQNLFENICLSMVSSIKRSETFL